MNNLDRLSVKNFGPIFYADIDFSPLTIFVGKNSSGKSFLSLLVHSLSNPFKSNNGIHRFPSSSFNYLIDNNRKLFEKFDNDLNQYINLKPTLLDDAFEFPLNKFVELIDEGFGKCYAKSIETNIKSNWKTTLNNLNRVKNYPFEIKFNNATFSNDSGKLISQDFNSEILRLINSINFVNPIGIKFSSNEHCIMINLDYNSLTEIYGHEKIPFAQIIYLLVVNQLMNHFIINSIYIPAGGEILNDFNKYISNEILGVNDSSNVQKEFINNLLDINEGTQKGYFYNLACQLEEEINNGEIQIKNNGLKDELIFVDGKNHLEFELNLISSSIHELIPLIIYLKYYLNKGDILIVEEIENHLHPENQLILVKYLVKAINQGLNVILTTHSDYILEKFNNLIILGNTQKEVFDELNYDETCILDSNDVSIYNFKKNEDYSYTPEKIDVNFTGFNDENFSQVIDELYKESDLILDNKLM